MKSAIKMAGFIIAGGMFVISCSTFRKSKSEKDKNNLVGAGVQDIVSQDIDSDGKGSDSGTIDGLSTVYFDYDSSLLSAESQDVLQKNLRWIQDHANVTRIELEGHCDTMGSEAYNVGLGRRRAAAVKNFLVSQGLSVDRLSIVSYGEERPLSDIDHAKNRRVNFVPLY